MSAWALHESESGLDSSSGLVTQLGMAAAITDFEVGGRHCYLLNLQLSSGQIPHFMLVDLVEESMLFI